MMILILILNLILVLIYDHDADADDSGKSGDAGAGAFPGKLKWHTSELPRTSFVREGDPIFYRSRRRKLRISLSRLT